MPVGTGIQQVSEGREPRGSEEREGEREAFVLPARLQRPGSRVLLSVSGTCFDSPTRQSPDFRDRLDSKRTVSLLARTGSNRYASPDRHAHPVSLLARTGSNRYGFPRGGRLSRCRFGAKQICFRPEPRLTPSAPAVSLPDFKRLAHY